MSGLVVGSISAWGKINCNASETNVLILFHKKIYIWINVTNCSYNMAITDIHVYVMVLFGVYTFMYPVSRVLLPISSKETTSLLIIVWLKKNQQG